MISFCHHQGDSYGSFSGTAVFSAASLRFLFSQRAIFWAGPGPTWSPAGGGLDQTTSTEPSMVFGIETKPMMILRQRDAAMV